MNLLETFLKKEIEYDMFNNKIFGINYWQYVRALISCEVNVTCSNSLPMFSKNSSSFRKYLLSIKNIKKYFLKQKECDILLISQPRRIKTDQGYKNNYVDFYEDYLKDKYKVLTIEEPTWSSYGISNKAHDFPIYTENIYLTDLHELNFLIKRFFYKTFKRNKYKKILNEYAKVSKTVNLWFNTDKINFKNLFVDSIMKLDIDKYYIKRILNKTKPKIVMFYYMPSIFKQMLIFECNERKIDTVEIQHGTITKYDPLINKCLDVSMVNNDTKYIFGFGPNQIDKTNISIKNINNIINVGSPFLEEKINSLKKQEKKYILFISQSTIGDYIASFASKLAKEIDNSKYKIVFKYHPNEMSKDYSCLKQENIIEIKQEKSIYELQNQSIIQIGVYSTALYEGFAMKVPTLIIKNMFGAEESIGIFKGIKKGVYYVNSYKEVLKYLDRTDIIPLDKDINELWTKNSKDRIVDEINKILRS